MVIVLQFLANCIATQWSAIDICLSLTKCMLVLILSVGSWKLYHHVPCRQLAVHFFRHFCCRVAKSTAKTNHQNFVVRNTVVKLFEMQVAQCARTVLQWHLSRTVRSCVLTNTCSRRHGAISGLPLPEWTDFGLEVAARQTHLCPASHSMTFTPQFSPVMTHCFSSKCYQVLGLERYQTRHPMSNIQ